MKLRHDFIATFQQRNRAVPYHFFIFFFLLQIIIKIPISFILLNNNPDLSDSDIYNTREEEEYFGKIYMPP